MTCVTLPASGNVVLSAICGAMGSASSCLGVPDSVMFHAVAYQEPSGQWKLFAARLMIGLHHEGPEHIIERSGRIALIAYAGRSEDLGDKASLESFLGLWSELLRQPAPAIHLQDSVFVRRESSKKAQWPAWTFGLYLGAQTANSSAVPSGPFYLPRPAMFAIDLDDAAAQWFEEPIRRNTAPATEVEVSLMDGRVAIKDLWRDGDRLMVEVKRTGARRIIVAGVVTDYDGRVTRVTAESNESGASLTMAPNARDLEVFVMGDDGFCYDTYREVAGRPVDGQRVLGVSSDGEASAQGRLLSAVANGESERVELKLVVPIERARDKSYELLKVACAFANTEGGSLFIGVSDDLEIRDLTSVVQKSHRASGSAEQARAWYAATLERMLREGLSPEVAVIISWVAVAGNHVLEVRVQPSKSLVHIVESGEAYLRKGANCKRALPSEIAALASGRVGGSRWPSR